MCLDAWHIVGAQLILVNEWQILTGVAPWASGPFCHVSDSYEFPLLHLRPGRVEWAWGPGDLGSRVDSAPLEVCGQASLSPWASVSPSIK